MVNDYFSCVQELITRWKRHIDRNFISDSKGNTLEKHLNGAYEDVHQYVKDGGRLLGLYRSFREWYAGQAMGRNPRWFDFLGYLQRKENERQEDNVEPLVNDCSLCEGLRWFDILLPTREDGDGLDPDPARYVPGEPIIGDEIDRLYEMSVPCACADRDPGVYGGMRSAHVEWYERAFLGEWSLYPGQTIRPTRAIHLYKRRLRAGNWEPEEE